MTILSIPKRISIAVVAFAITGTSIVAHHSFSAEFDANKPVKITGTVTKIEWLNPHVWFYMDVKDDAGKVVTWGFENAGVSQLAQAGYNRNTLKVGQDITAIVNPAANGAPTAIVVKVILADGSEIMSRETGDNPAN